MSALFTIMKHTLVSVKNSPILNNKPSINPIFSKIIRRHAKSQKELKILIPYSSTELFFPELQKNHTLEFVYLDTKMIHVKKKLMKETEKRDGISFIDNDLRTFRAKAYFDLVFCAPTHIENETDRLLEDLCHCRLLLKPGGKVFLYLENHEHESTMEKFGLQKGVVAEMLLRSGLSDVTKHRHSHGQVFCSGQRPSYNF